MEQITIKAKFDAVVGKEEKLAHFTLGTRKDNISGGMYIPVGMELPTQIIVEVPRIAKGE